MTKTILTTIIAAAVAVSTLSAQPSGQGQRGPSNEQAITSTSPRQAPLPGRVPNRLEERKETQQKRIAQGVASGQLTPRETRHIEAKEQAINKEVRTERKANGGKLTQVEKNQVNRQQNRVSKQIYTQKHDAQKQQ